MEIPGLHPLALALKKLNGAECIPRRSGDLPSGSAARLRQKRLAPGKAWLIVGD